MFVPRSLLACCVAVLSFGLAGCDESAPSKQTLCCPITAEPVPGDCTELGGSAEGAGSCTSVCDGPDTYVRITDAAGCPKLVVGSCLDGSADAAFCR